MGTIEGRGHHRHDRDTAHGAHGLLYEERGEDLHIGGVHIGEDVRVRRDGVETVLLAELQLEVLQFVAVTDASGLDGVVELV